MLKTSRHQIRRMIQNGKLPAVKVDREWRIIRNGLRIIWGSRTNRNPRLSIGYFYTAGFESGSALKGRQFRQQIAEGTVIKDEIISQTCIFGIYSHFAHNGLFRPDQKQDLHVRLSLPE